MSCLGEKPWDLYKAPTMEQRKSETLREEGNKIVFTYLRIGRGEVAGFEKGRRVYFPPSEPLYAFFIYSKATQCNQQLAVQYDDQFSIQLSVVFAFFMCST